MLRSLVSHNFGTHVIESSLEIRLSQDAPTAVLVSKIIPGWYIVLGPAGEEPTDSRAPGLKAPECWGLRT